MEEHQFLTESQHIEVDQVDTTCDNDDDDYAISRNGSPVNEKRPASQQADLVHSSQQQEDADSSSYLSRVQHSKKMNNNKMKFLVRSHALREAASPPPDSPSPSPFIDDSSAPSAGQQHPPNSNQQAASLVITVVESRDDASSPQPQEMAQVLTNRLRPRVQVQRRDSLFLNFKTLVDNRLTFRVCLGVEFTVQCR